MRYTILTRDEAGLVSIIGFTNNLSVESIFNGIVWKLENGGYELPLTNLVILDTLKDRSMLIKHVGYKGSSEMDRQRHIHDLTLKLTYNKWLPIENKMAQK